MESIDTSQAEINVIVVKRRLCNALILDVAVVLDRKKK